MIFVLALIFIVALIVIYNTFIIVNQQAAYVKERLGSYAGTMEAGFHFLIPIIDRVAYKHTLKEEVIDVPSQNCITKDNVQVEVDGILYIKVMNPELASYGINDYRFAAIQLAQTSMRSEIGKLEMDRTFVERVTINDNVVKALDLAGTPWGVKVVRYEIKNIVPPKAIIHTMEQQMRAEREKRADIARSEGTRTALINASEGERKESINLSEGERQRKINIAEGQAQQIEIIAAATAEGLTAVSAAILEPGGLRALKLRIAEEYIKQFGNLVSTSKVTVVPLDVAKIQGTFQGLGHVINQVK
jgi:regulator of protease activity HflC (stomatin/prohibitin superfamily)